MQRNVFQYLKKKKEKCKKNSNISRQSIINQHRVTLNDTRALYFQRISRVAVLTVGNNGDFRHDRFYDAVVTLDRPYIS